MHATCQLGEAEFFQGRREGSRGLYQDSALPPSMREANFARAPGHARAISVACVSERGPGGSQTFGGTTSTVLTNPASDIERMRRHRHH